MNIFEPRYLAMVNYALATPTRLIGMVQPVDPKNLTPDNSNAVPDLFRSDVPAVSQPFRKAMMGDISLPCLANRFRLAGDAMHKDGFRPAMVDRQEFDQDLRIDVSHFDRRPLMTVMKRYFEMKGLRQIGSKLKSPTTKRCWRLCRWCVRLRSLKNRRYLRRIPWRTAPTC